MRSQRRFMGYFLVFCLFITPTIQCYDQAFLDHVANSNLNTFEVIDQQNDANKPKPIDKQTFTELVSALFTPRNFSYQALDDRNKREIVFKQAPSNPQTGTPVVDTSFVNKMELVHGEARPGDHLANRIMSHDTFNLIRTEFGKKRCMEMLSQPICNIDELNRRQAIIREFALDSDLINKCDHILKEISKAEELLFDLYQYDSIPESEKILYFSPFFDQMGLNRSKTALSVSTRFGQITNTLSTLGTVAYAYYIPRLFTSQMQEKDAKKPRMILTGILGTIITLPLSLILLSVQKQFINMSQNMQQKLIALATYINGIKKLIQIMDAHEALKEQMPQLQDITRQLNGSKRKSKEFNELCSLLNKSTFQPGEPSFFSSQGNVLMAYQHVVNETIRKEFTDALNLLGDLDLYVAIAKKMKIHQKLPVHYCFAQFTEGTPSITAKQFWNPFLPVETVVPNSIEFNANAMNNMILTGPNTGGKSATLKGLMINVLLAQTFGIAAADQLIITPFAKLTCHMNITDDTGAGISLFKAEVQRAHELMDMVRKLAPNEYAFIIIDEIFTGTSPDKAEELSYKFIKQLGDFPNVILINATHFKKLIGLEQESKGRSKNYHMAVITDASGKVTKYTYTLTYGPSPVNNASQIVQEEGIF